MGVPIEFVKIDKEDPIFYKDKGLTNLDSFFTNFAWTKQTKTRTQKMVFGFWLGLGLIPRRYGLGPTF